MLLQYDVSTNPLNTVEWLFAAMECVHISAFALSIGTIALVDMSLLGVGLEDQSPAKILRATEMWTMAGLTVVISAGLAIFSSDPFRYYYSPTFRFKMWCLLGGIIFNYTIHRKVVQSSPSPIVARLTGAISLVLWTTVIFCGLFFAFTAGGY